MTRATITIDWRFWKQISTPTVIRRARLTLWEFIQYERLDWNQVASTRLASQTSDFESGDRLAP